METKREVRVVPQGQRLERRVGRRVGIPMSEASRLYAQPNIDVTAFNTRARASSGSRDAET